MTTVVGVDGCGKGWIFAAIDDGQLATVEYFDAFEDGVERFPSSLAFGVDVPIGLPATGVRSADIAARSLAGVSPSSVFTVPPRSVLEKPTYDEAKERSAELTGKKISKQSFALAPKIFEVEPIAQSDSRVFEVHPEVSFSILSGGITLGSKKTWNGVTARRNLLAETGLAIPDNLAAAGLKAAPDDVVDAVVAAWTAQRKINGLAVSIPDPPEFADGRAIAIWA